ncbi:putative holin [Chromobacterium haemolyticum]|uniref:Phage holin n=1 Tax=Chromobacterium haemolyticum TaxID=394935 RepID=A0A1W0CDL7_9NEIS|nr:putative holin [Chromobacterium haemolyticum]OQS32839.1 hypothetical protein B0T45_21295 [Chromobacterium haemolyticum]QOD84197.1 hypothetical protein IEZ30_06900 [Chromobacterium haemolyticum]
MSEPVSSGGAAVMAGVLGAASLVPYLNDGVLFASFAGGAVFVLSARDYSWRERVVYLFVSVVIGTICARFAAGIIDAAVDAITQRDLTVPDSAGALLASAVSVRILQGFIRRFESGPPVAPWEIKK